MNSQSFPKEATGLMTARALYVNATTRSALSAVSVRHCLFVDGGEK